MIKQVIILPFAACVLSLACAHALASSSPYSTMIVFGDSLADSGQFPDTAGPAGSTLRFTNRTGPTFQDGSGEVYGPVSSTLLGLKLGVAPGDLVSSTSPANAAAGVKDGNNWAVGGYRTDQIYDSITSTSDVSTDVGGTDVSLRSRTGYLPANGFRADPNALYYLTGGGNDFFQGQITDVASAQASAGRLANSAQVLQQDGARYIMVWLLPDVGLTPLAFGTPLQNPATQLSSAFDAELLTRLAPLHAIPLNVPGLIQDVLVNPARFGVITGPSLLGTCFSGDGCTENPTYGLHSATPDPTKLLFNDDVHPTIAGQRLIADYAYSILSAPWEVSLMPEMGLGALNAHQDELRNQWQADWGNWQGIGEWRAIVAGGGQYMDFDNKNGSASADGHGYNLTIGGSYRLNEVWRAGVAAGFYRQTLEAGERDSVYTLNSYLATAFVQYQANRFWGDAALTGGKLDFEDANRKFALGVTQGGEQGDTDGNLWAFSARVGYDIAQTADSLWHLSPFVSADYAHVTVDGYSEDSMRATALSYDAQRRSSRRLGAGLQGKYQILPQTQVFAEYAHEHEYATNQQDVTIALNSLPNNDFTLQGYKPQGSLNRASLGVSQKLTQAVSLSGNYNWRKDDDVTQQGISLAVSLDF
jgi:outer membrane lipase/esterase